MTDPDREKRRLEYRRGALYLAAVIWGTTVALVAFEGFSSLMHTYDWSRTVVVFMMLVVFFGGFWIAGLVIRGIQRENGLDERYIR